MNLNDFVWEVIKHVHPWTHLMVWRKDGENGITWDELQFVKNKVLGEYALCIEVYPPVSSLVNRGNYRHLWEVPDNLKSLIPNNSFVIY